MARTFESDPSAGEIAASEVGPQTVKTIYIHWSATPYNWAPKGHYHTVVTGDGVAHRLTPPTTMLDEHTYRRNTNSVGFATACMGGNDPWSTPCTSAQIETMCKEIAALAKSLGWKPADITIKRVMTHAEAASNRDNPNNPPHDNYGPMLWGGTGERWDYLVIKKGDKEGSGGDILRTKIKGYLTKILETGSGPAPQAVAGSPAPQAVASGSSGNNPLPQTLQDLPPEIGGNTNQPIPSAPRPVPTNSVRASDGTELFSIQKSLATALFETFIMKTIDFTTIGPSPNRCTLPRGSAFGINMSAKVVNPQGWLAVNIDVPGEHCFGFTGPVWVNRSAVSIEAR